VRIAGPEHFPSVEALADDTQPLANEFVGMALPHFSEDQRAALEADIERFREAALGRH
jgi:hypothetical protein